MKGFGYYERPGKPKWSNLQTPGTLNISALDTMGFNLVSGTKRTGGKYPALVNGVC